MRTVELSTFLPTRPVTVWEHAQTPRLLHYVSHGLIRFLPKGGPWPERWSEGQYQCWMLLFGFVPIGWQTIGIEFASQAPGTFVVRDNGFGPLIRRWDHWITIAAEGNGTRYTDRVHIEAGVLTPLIWTFARIFYAHRQRRWRKLVTSAFRYGQDPG